jgi:hypothetical protein
LESVTKRRRAYVCVLSASGNIARTKTDAEWDVIFRPVLEAAAAAGPAIPNPPNTEYDQDDALDDPCGEPD